LMQIPIKSTYINDKMHLKKLQAKMCWETDNTAPVKGWVNFDSKYLALGEFFHEGKFVLF
jgi:hypothetical protein